MFKLNYLLAFLAICLFGLSSCSKENLDDTTTTDDDPVLVVVNCDDFDVLLIENEGDLVLEVIEGTGPYTYLWSTEETTASITPDEDGVYSVIVTDVEGCTTSEEITFEMMVDACDGFSGSINAPDTNTPLDFTATSEAYLWKEGCPEVNSFFEYDHNYLVVDASWDNWGSGGNYSVYAVADGLPGFTFGSNGIPQVGDVLTPYFEGEDLFRNDGNPLSSVYIFDGIQITITETSNELGGNIAGTISGTIVDLNDSNNSSSISGTFCVPIVSVCE